MNWNQIKHDFKVTLVNDWITCFPALITVQQYRKQDSTNWLLLIPQLFTKIKIIHLLSVVLIITDVICLEVVVFF